jgi:hypothetical protein
MFAKLMEMASCYFSQLSAVFCVKKWWIFLWSSFTIHRSKNIVVFKLLLDFGIL